MLELILGRSGSGKTETVWRRLEDAVSAENAGSSYVLIVPEQFSFETEKALLRRLGPSRSMNVKVYSFTRMAEMVRREVGGHSYISMSNATRVLLLDKAVRELSDHLSVYAARKTDGARLRSMLTLLEEFHGCAITADRLREVSETLGDTALARKLADLSLIDDAYRTLIAQSRLDAADALDHLVEDLPQSRFFADATVFIDGFKSYTGQELRVLETLFQVARDVTVTVPCDPYAVNTDQLDLFSEGFHTARKLESTARRLGVKVKPSVRLTENRRHAGESALAALESGLFRAEEGETGHSDGTVELMSCGTREDECRLAVRRLHRFLREGGRLREATVVVRHLPDYRGILEPMLSRAGIPVHVDDRETIRTDPLIVTVIEALSAVTEHWQSESLLRLMKTGLLGFSPKTIAKMENYVYMWNVRGAAWKREWTANPAGLTAETTPETTRSLWMLNLLRRRLVRPLLTLQKKLADGLTAEQFARAIYEYLEDARVRRLVRLRVRRLKQSGELFLADRAARMWETLMDLLDQFAASAGDETQSAKEFLSLFTLSAELTDLGSIPSSVDMVQMGQADHVRYSHPKLVLILGANEGVFPATTEKTGLLGDAERLLLQNDGLLPLTDTSAHRLMEERYFAYAAASAPKNELYVSFLTVTDGNETAVPSLLVEEMCRVLPDLPTLTDDPKNAETAEELLHYAAVGWKETDTLSVSLRAACESSAATKDRYQLMLWASQDRRLRFDTPAQAKKLFTGLSYLSPTAVETYYECRFGYFCRYGLKLKQREKAELNSLTFGSAAHRVMEVCIPVYTKRGFDTLKKADVMQDAAKALADYVEESMGGVADKPDRFLYLLSRLERLCGHFLWHVVRELRQSRFVPTDFELKIGDPTPNEPTIPPLQVELADGTIIRMIGIVDRVDVYKAGDQSYIRIVDYKTGHKDFRLDDVINGINLQMLIYLSALWENGGPRYGTVIPAGMLYLPSKLPVVDANKPQQEREQLKTMTMNGLILDNPEIVCAMEAEAEGLFIPVKLNKKGEISAPASAAVATLAQFGMLKRRAETLLRQMANTLREGDVSAIPTVSKTVDACKFCPYHAVCGREEDDPSFEIPAASNREMLDALTEKEEGDAPDDHDQTRGSGDPPS